MFYKTRVRMAALAALVMGIPLAEEARAQSGLDIFFASLNLADAISAAS